LNKIFQKFGAGSEKLLKLMHFIVLRECKKDEMIIKEGDEP